MIKSIRDFSLSGRLVFVRVDFNVPIVDGIITDDNRIREALPTLRFAIEKGARIILASHLGRPDGQRKPEFSLEPVAVALSAALGQDVLFPDDCIGDGIELMAKGLKNGDVMLLENLRFYPGEEANDPGFSARLARLGEIYINDAFGTAHRKHASTYGVPTLISERGMGLLIEKELKFLDPLLRGPQKPFFMILGGSKVSDKMKTIDSLLPRVQGVVIGGAMAHAFWLAEGKSLPEGVKKPKSEDVEAARSILKAAKRREVPLLTPLDTNLGFDIGPKTVIAFQEFLSKAKTIFWNGPLGWFEKPEYATGTFEMARFLAQKDALKIVGGGDTVSAIHASGVAEKFEHLSTGGGAVLEYLEGRGLPGIDILKLSTREQATARKPLES